MPSNKSYKNFHPGAFPAKIIQIPLDGSLVNLKKVIWENMRLKPWKNLKMESQDFLNYASL